MSNFTPIRVWCQPHWFRSTLEARWATLFDAFGLDFLYEPKVFKTDHGSYLPDFKIQNIWIEIKPVQPSGVEINKLSAVVNQTGEDGILISGFPVVEKTLNKRGLFDEFYTNCSGLWLRKNKEPSNFKTPQKLDEFSFSMNRAIKEVSSKSFSGMHSVPVGAILSDVHFGLRKRKK